jgi:hypothetical protein
LRSDN